MFDNVYKESQASKDFDAILEVETLDISTFRELRTSIDDDLVFSDLITIYLNSAETLVEEIQLAFTTQDIRKLGMSAHSLKSTSASIGAMQLSQICRYLEKNSKREEVQISKAWIDLLCQSYDRMTLALKSCILEFMAELKE